MRRFDGATQRVLIVGRTGSGKSHAGLEALSCVETLDEMPWVGLDFKGNDLLASVPVTRQISISENPPDEPGLYVARCRVEDNEKFGAVSSFMMKIYSKGNTGVFVDEGGALGHHSRGFRYCLTQGRALRIPMIIITQRPYHLDNYAWSESEFKQTFALDLAQDQDKVVENFPRGKVDFEKLHEAGEHYSYYWDVLGRSCELVPPGPDFEQIYGRLLTMLPIYQQEKLLGTPRAVRV